MSDGAKSVSKKYRLQHYLSLCGYASRRASEACIIDGLVTVDGEIASIGQQVEVSQDIRVNGVGVRWQRALQEDAYYIFHKPSRTLCSHKDDTGRGRRLVYEYFSDVDSKRLFSLGRLDYMTSGLLLLSSDGQFVQSVIHPAEKIEKEYLVVAKKEIPDELLKNFVKGIYYEGVRYKAKTCQRISAHSVQIILEEGKNRELRNVFLSYRIPLKKVHRLRLGSLTLKGLAPGTFRKMSPKEMKQITKGQVVINKPIKEKARL